MAAGAAAATSGLALVGALVLGRGRREREGVQNIQDYESNRPRVLTDNDGNPLYFAQATSGGNTWTDGSGNIVDRGVDPLENRIDLSKPIKDSYNEFKSGEKEFSRKDFVDYIQSIASETYKEQGVLDFVKDVGNTLTFAYLKKEASLMLPKSQAAQKGLTLLGSYRDIKSLTEHVSALVGSEMDTIKGVMRQEMIVQTEKLLEANNKYYETEKKAIETEQKELAHYIAKFEKGDDLVFRASKDSAWYTSAVDRATELTVRDVQLTSLFKDNGKHLDQIRLLKNKNLEIIEDSINQANVSQSESDLSRELSKTLANIYGSDSTDNKSFVSQNQKMNQYVEVHENVRYYEILGDVASIYPKSPAVDIMLSATKIGVLNNFRTDLENDFRKYSTSSSARAGEFHKALRTNIFKGKIE